MKKSDIAGWLFVLLLGALVVGAGLDCIVNPPPSHKRDSPPSKFVPLIPTEQEIDFLYRCKKEERAALDQWKKEAMESMKKHGIPRLPDEHGHLPKRKK